MPAPRPITKLLVANRGEIALRVMRTCREMGVRTVAVFSDADRNALHVRAAYEAVRLGPAPVKESYLRGEALIAAAQATGADAIHPGYGFLSENAGFARAVRDAGLIFVGPSPEAIEAMGDKLAARARMAAAGVPVVPGTSEPAGDDASLLAQARALGFPLMIKASAGGGGKGIRIVRDESELVASARRAASEAQSSFADGRIYLEKYLEEPRHIEIQVFGDSHGQIVHLGERECSLQRRHQKVVEERPSPLLDEPLRAAMGAAAVKAASAIGYTNAGTIEFLVDRQRRFYLLEMNTRLQVEHPITELTCGQDLVRWQLLVAGGQRLPLGQEQIRHEGHAIEVRLCAEDADRGFLPATGRVQRLELPGGPGVRVDGCLYEGLEVTPHYDPLLAKICVHAETRQLAVARLRRALAEVTVSGVLTNLPFLRRVLDSEAFRSGRYDTTTLESRPAEFAPQISEGRERSAALIAATMAHVLRARRGFPDREAPPGAPVVPGSAAAAASAPVARSAWVEAFRPGSEP
ncbi:MAG TPA: acetyl-CoA carboxylase biotin carboxylase subunit [Planctomycetota bacterium]|nr:acetyl-CoA carboxylase biotin carboxylase subunit [Planctomycetota bacterium]